MHFRAQELQVLSEVGYIFTMAGGWWSAVAPLLHRFFFKMKRTNVFTPCQYLCIILLHWQIVTYHTYNQRDCILELFLIKQTNAFMRGRAFTPPHHASFANIRTLKPVSV